jgi:hypothetical protein
MLPAAGRSSNNFYTNRAYNSEICQKIPIWDSSADLTCEDDALSSIGFMENVSVLYTASVSYRPRAKAAPSSRVDRYRLKREPLSGAIPSIPPHIRGAPSIHSGLVMQKVF